MFDNANQGDFCGFRVRENRANRQIEAVQEVSRLARERTVASDAVYRPVKPATLRVFAGKFTQAQSPLKRKDAPRNGWGRAAAQKGGRKQGNDLVH